MLEVKSGTSNLGVPRWTLDTQNNYDWGTRSPAGHALASSYRRSWEGCDSRRPCFGLSTESSQKAK